MVPGASIRVILGNEPFLPGDLVKMVFQEGEGEAFLEDSYKLGAGFEQAGLSQNSVNTGNRLDGTPLINPGKHNPNGSLSFRTFLHNPTVEIAIKKKL